MRTLNGLEKHDQPYSGMEKANTETHKEKNKGWDLMNTNIAFYLSNLEVLFVPSA
jgi:hypothetical protein